VTIFADASALVALYAAEDGRDTVEALETATVSELSAVEVVSALWGKQRREAISAERAGVLVRRFQADLFGSPSQPARFTIVPLRSEVLRDAAAVVAPRALAAGDAIQLASALAARRADPDATTTFACFDRRLRVAAAAEGFALVP
jgi:predicted nucleic acid-binding protein